ncbi:hypothetical protein F4824DRAFT_454472 [Ustulina deusta]|nr:hypothetical protein F4824DRAFT_454472 [Ustulina deusta]
MSGYPFEKTNLPQGLMGYKDSMYREIAKFNVVPIHWILKASSDSTTLSRKLTDPTARRLANFWTRVLGGNRRYLPGTVIAQLFKQICEEPGTPTIRGQVQNCELPSLKARTGQRLHFESRRDAGHFSHLPQEAGTRQIREATCSIPRKAVESSTSGARPRVRFNLPTGGKESMAAGM